MKQIEIVIDDKPVIVKKIPLKKLAYLISSLKDVPKIIAEFENKSSQDIFANLGVLVDKFYPDVVKILVTATDVNPDEVETWGIADLVIVAEAVWEVNQLKVVLDQAKKIKAQPKNPPSVENSILSNGSTP